MTSSTVDEIIIWEQTDGSIHFYTFSDLEQCKKFLQDFIPLKTERGVLQVWNTESDYNSWWEIVTRTKEELEQLNKTGYVFNCFKFSPNEPPEHIKLFALINRGIPNPVAQNIPTL